MSPKKNINPFYVLLLLSGTAFAITAMAFGVMTVRGLQASRMAGYVPIEGSESQLSYDDDGSFDRFMDRRGTQLLIIELAILAISTFGAIAYDRMLDRRNENSPPQERSTSPTYSESRERHDEGKSPHGS